MGGRNLQKIALLRTKHENELKRRRVAGDVGYRDASHDLHHSTKEGSDVLRDEASLA